MKETKKKMMEVSNRQDSSGKDSPQRVYNTCGVSLRGFSHFTIQQ